MIRTSHRLAALALVAGAALAPTMAAAQTTEPRFALHAELAAGRMLSSHQLDQLQYGWLLQGTLRGGVRLVGPLYVQLSAGYWHFFSDAGFGSVTPITGGLRVEPRIGSVGHLFVDANAGVALTGSAPLARFTFDVGLGFEFAVSRRFHVGPFVRYAQVVAASSDFDADARYLSFGASLGLHLVPADEDRDHDGVVDRDDVCPDDPQGDTPDPNRAGCPVADRDHDGVVDADDQCPDTPQGETPDAQRPGCTMNDRDHDGVIDASDRCVDVPRGDHEDPDRAGCPDPDSDGDGLRDHEDRCPREAQGVSPDPARPGCPVADRDHDSVPDAVDHCPDTPGAPSSDPARNGCPGLVQVDTQRGQIVLTQPVFFATNRDVILATSDPVLQALREVLASTPSIRRVAIEGHTDNVGTRAHNTDLSQRRAQQVMRWLVEHDIDASRLEAHGYGPDRPIESNTNATGRARNRRVEFHILDPASNAQ